MDSKDMDKSIVCGFFVHVYHNPRSPSIENRGYRSLELSVNWLSY